MSLVRFFELFEEKSCTLVKRLIFFGRGGGRVQGEWGVTQRHELRVSFKVNMKTKCLDSIIVLFLI